MSKQIYAKDLYGKEHAVEAADVIWRPSVYGIVIHDGKVLLSPQHNLGYDLPGGGVDIDESLEAAVVREVKEETGLDVRVTKLVTVADNFFIWKPESEQDRATYHSVLCYYRCELVGGEISTDGFDEDEQEYAQMAEWVDLDKVTNISIASSYDFRPIIAECAIIK